MTHPFRLLIALASAAMIAVATAAEPNTPGVDAIQAANREFMAGQFDRALATLDQAGEPAKSAFALDLRGCILMEQGKLAEAVEVFKAAHEAEPRSGARLHMGDALLRQGKWEEARDVYQTAAKETNILMHHERLRFATLMSYLGQKDDAGAQQALNHIFFPTESAAYYYAQAAWAFAHGERRSGDKWIRRAGDIFPEKSTAWFARHLYERGWIKAKPPLTAE